MACPRHLNEQKKILPANSAGLKLLVMDIPTIAQNAYGVSMSTSTPETEKRIVEE